MVVIILESAPPSVRGRLRLWFVELRAGVYVGDVSARLAERVWGEVVGAMPDGSAVMVRPDSRTEFGFSVRVSGTNRRTPFDADGLPLCILAPGESLLPDQAAGSKGTSGTPQSSSGLSSIT